MFLEILVWYRIFSFLVIVNIPFPSSVRLKTEEVVATKTVGNLSHNKCFPINIFLKHSVGHKQIIYSANTTCTKQITTRRKHKHQRWKNTLSNQLCSIFFRLLCSVVVRDSDTIARCDDEFGWRRFWCANGICAGYSSIESDLLETMYEWTSWCLVKSSSAWYTRPFISFTNRLIIVMKLWQAFSYDVQRLASRIHNERTFVVVEHSLGHPAALSAISGRLRKIGFYHT